MNFPAELNEKVEAQKLRNETFWKGPDIDGLTQSLLDRFMSCRHRFWVKTVLGLAPPEGFSAAIEFGNYWHYAEESFAAGEPIEQRLLEYAKELCDKYPDRKQDVLNWYNMCLMEFPLYADYWKDHPDVKNRKPLVQECNFRVSYVVHGDRQVTLRGKWDSVDQVGKNKLVLQENKTKAQINELELQRSLTFDMQTMIYVAALRRAGISKLEPSEVRYNVIRRPLHTQKKPTKSNPGGESLKEYYDRVAGEIKKKPDHFFMRWNTPISSADIDVFEETFLVPILNELCRWWEWVKVDPLNPFRYPTEGEVRSGYANIAGGGVHYRAPYGRYDPLAHGGSSDVDAFINTGSRVGLERVRTLFPELEG